MISQTLASAAAAALLCSTGVALASSHREAPAISQDPAADNTDLYAWVDRDGGNLVVVANYNPLNEPAGGPNFHSFSSSVLYEVNVARGPDSLRPVFTYQFEFRSPRPERVDAGDLDGPLVGGHQFFRQLSGQEQVLTVHRVEHETGRRRRMGARMPVAPPNIGPRTQAVLFEGAPYDDAFAARFIHDLDGGGRVFAGPRDDGFYVDLGGVFDLANLRPRGEAQDGVAGFNTMSIAIEIPLHALTADGEMPALAPSAENTLGIWATASRRKTTIRRNNGRVRSFGPWVQVSRLGLPLVNEVLIGIQDKDKFNASRPWQDLRRFAAYFLNPVVVRDAEAVGIYAALEVDPTPFKSDRTDIINIISLNDGTRQINTVGDVLRVDIGTESAFPNGRPIPGGALPHQEQADVTDVLMTVILAGGALPLGDNVDYNDKPFLDEFPFLALPHRGFDEGHGVPTPSLESED